MLKEELDHTLARSDMQTTDVLWNTLTRINLEIESKLSRVKRWSKYIHHEDGSTARTQTVAEHLLSAMLNADIFASIIGPYIQVAGGRFDEDVFKRAVMLHDYGEIIHAPEYGGNGYDTLYQAKNSSGDVSEYERFMELIEPLIDHYPRIWKMYSEAFSIQFVAYRRWEEWSEDVQDAFRKASEAYVYEVLAFEALERWGYILFALEQFRYPVHQNTRILVDVIDAQAPHLDRLASDLPGFCEEIWTSRLREEAKKFLLSNIHQYQPEQEDRKLWRHKLLNEVG